LKNGFAAAQKSFSLTVSMHILVINYETLSPFSERRKTFDSLLANHFSAVMQSSYVMKTIGYEDLLHAKAVFSKVSWHV